MLIWCCCFLKVLKVITNSNSNTNSSPLPSSDGLTLCRSATVINPAEVSLARTDGAKGKVSKSRCECIAIPLPEIDAMVGWLLGYLLLSAMVWCMPVSCVGLLLAFQLSSASSSTHFCVCKADETGIHYLNLLMS